MITLHKYVPAWGTPDISTFCIKVETYLRMAGLPFRPVVTDSRKAPKKKLPYVDDGGTIVCDSRDIIAHFEAKIPNPLDAGLSPAERALATAYRGLLEEEVYFYGLYQRWQLDAGFRLYAPVLREYARAIGVPAVLAPIILRAVRKQLVRDTWGQGTGRHTEAQVDARLREAIDAVAVQLGDKPFFLGERPRVIDATVYAFLLTMTDTPFESRATRHARTLENVRAYCARIRQNHFAQPAALSSPASAATTR